MDLIKNDSEITHVFLSSLEEVLEGVEDILTHYRPVLGGESYLSGNEVCEKLHISKRTLQDYRDKGLLAYVQLPGKIIYRNSDIEALLENHYRDNTDLLEFV